jgi:hypothetical protein
VNFRSCKDQARHEVPERANHEKNSRLN